MRLLPYRCLDGDDPGEGFADATCMMSPHGTAWRRQKEEAGAERGFHFQAMRQHVGLVLCLGSCEGLGRGPRKADGVGRIVNQVVLGPGQFWGSWLLMAWGADGWLPFDSLCGNLWILVMAMAGFTSWQLLLRIWCDFLFITELAGQWQALLLVSFGFGGLAVGQCHASYGSFGLVSCWDRERLGQCPARLDSFDLLAGAHERGGLRSERSISPMLRLYVQEGGLFLRLCMHRLAASFWGYMYRMCF